MKKYLFLFALLTSGCFSLDTTQLSQFSTGCSSVKYVSGAKSVNTTWGIDQTYWIVRGCEKTWCCQYNASMSAITTCKACK